MTRVYMELQGLRYHMGVIAVIRVTRGYKGSGGVLRVTRGYKGSGGVLGRTGHVLAYPASLRHRQRHAPCSTHPHHAADTVMPRVLDVRRDTR